MNTQSWLLPILPEEVADICRRYHIAWMALFGSAARGEMDELSDYDFVIEFEKEATPSLFDLVHIQRELEDQLGRRVDLGTRSSIKPLLRSEILDNAVVVYAN